MNKLLLRENYDSQNLWQKISVLSEEQHVGIANGLDWTVKNIPSAVLIGGTAVVHYIKGARDLTPDLDFLVGNIGSVRNKLAIDGIQYQELNPGYSEPLGLTVEMLNTDYLDAQAVNPRLNQLILQTPVTANIGGRQMRIINPELLAINKFETGRDKDVNDAFALLNSGKVNKDRYRDYLRNLKPVLQDYESMVSYMNFIN